MTRVPTPTPTRPAYRATLAAYLGPQKGKALLLFGLMLADISLDLLGPWIQGRFLDAALEGAPLDTLTRIALLFLLVSLMVQGLYIVSNYIATDLAQTGTNRLREDLMDQMLRLGHGFHNRYRTGALVERIDGDVATLGNFLSRFLLELVGSVFLLAGVLWMLYRVDPRIGGLLSLFALVAVLAMRALISRATPRFVADREAHAELFGEMEEQLAGAEDLRASGAVGHALWRLVQRSRALLARRVVASSFGALTGGASFFILSAGTAIALVISASLYREGAISLGTVFLVFRYSQLLQGPIDAISRQVADLQQAGAAIGRVGELLSARPEVLDPEHPRPLAPGALDLVFDELSFAYQPDQPVLQEISFDLPAGGSLGLLGRTGSGKTTLSRMLFRLADPDAGSLRIGGEDPRNLRLADLRKHVALVTQDVQLFRASIRDNLRLFDAGVDDAAILEAVRAVGMEPWLQAQPDGLDSMLQPGGSGLSAGQAQLLALARVFLRDPGLVVLDEASSRLDPATEARLGQALDLLLEGRTAILIAHRLSTLSRVDRIAILEGGRLVEFGEREALAADPDSRFRQLLAAGELADAAGAVEAEGDSER